MMTAKRDDAKVAAVRLLEIVAAPATLLAALLLKLIRRFGVHRLPLSKAILLRVGVFPIRDHYYEPLFDGRKLSRPLSEPRALPGIDWNVRGQLALLSGFNYNDELRRIPSRQGQETGFYFENSAFGSSDAEFYYNVIRHLKPARVFEIGSGFSTLIAIEAIKRNRAENDAYRCEHVCIEPYEMPWLERAPVRLLRKRVEELGTNFFAELGLNDILFIDSSHVIRPQGDVLFEYLELLPSLAPGVIVHVHDIFSPGDYPAAWAVDEVRLWNEQYLLEAFLTNNDSWRIIGALSFLKDKHFAELSAKCPRLSKEHRPGSFYIHKVK